MDDGWDRTEAPTPRRIREARDRGIVARSGELNAAVLLLAMLLLLWWQGPAVTAEMRLVMTQMLGQAAFTETSIGAAAVMTMLGSIAAATLPLLAGLVLAAVVVNLAQVGFIASVHPLKPKLTAISPLQGIGRMFRDGQAVIQLGMILLKLALVAIVVWWSLRGRLEQIVLAQRLGNAEAFVLVGQMVFSIGLRVAMLLVGLGLIDYAWQRHRTNKRLRMSLREVKEELRCTETDPLIQQRRREVSRRARRQRLYDDVPAASIVITSASDVAVALKYDPAAMDAPKVVAKGRGALAQHICGLAMESGIPLVDRPPLAAGLFRACKAGDDIPKQAHAAVAEVLAYADEIARSEI